jgi:hypothetical protein
VRLDAALLRKALPPGGWAAPAAVWGAVNTAAGAIQTLRRHGRLAGWRLRWWPEPLTAERGVLWPELTLRRGATSVGLLPLPSAQLAADAAALGALAERLSFIILPHPVVPRDIPAALTVMPCGDDRLAALLGAYLERRGASGGHDVLPEWLAAITDAARAAGSLAESDLARRLDCPEDEVGVRLTPAADTTGDLVYIDGFGLSTVILLGQARAIPRGDVRQRCAARPRPHRAPVTRSSGPQRGAPRPDRLPERRAQARRLTDRTERAGDGILKARGGR